MMMVETKKCKRCGEVKLLSEFYTGRNVCKQCRYEQLKKSRLKHHEALRIRRQKYYQKHRESILGKSRQYSIDNKESISIRKKKYRLDNHERLSEYAKQYYQLHREDILRKIRDYRDSRKASLLTKAVEAVEEQKVCNLTQDEIDFLMDELDYQAEVQQGIQTENDEYHLTQDEINFLLDTL